MRTTTSSTTKLVAAGLIALMAVGSVLLWLGIPLGWIYLASRVSKSSQPTLGPIVMVIVGIPLSMALVGKLLSRLNVLYGEVTGTTPHVRVVLPWLRSMRAEREPSAPRTILDVVMVVSVGVAVVLFGIWFFFFAGSSLPGS
jgi:hypothetical protein